MHFSVLAQSVNPRLMTHRVSSSGMTNHMQRPEADNAVGVRVIDRTDDASEAP